MTVTISLLHLVNIAILNGNIPRVIRAMYKTLRICWNTESFLAVFPPCTYRTVSLLRSHDDLAPSPRYRQIDGNTVYLLRTWSQNLYSTPFFQMVQVFFEWKS